MLSFMKVQKVHGDGDNSEVHANRDKILAALFYGISSLAVIFTNKAIMSEYHFPYFNFLACVQFVATTLILSILIVMKRIDVPVLSWGIVKEILPISLMFLGNVICGLGSTKSLNLPMFTALRRFSIFFTMLAEWSILNSKPSYGVVGSILMMVGGALLAAVYDLSYDTSGYTLVFLNNVFTTMNGVWMKKASISGNCSKMGVLFYNSLFSATFMVLYFIIEHYVTNDVNNDGAISNAYNKVSSVAISEMSGRRLLEVVANSVTDSGVVAAAAAAGTAIPSAVVAAPELIESTLTSVYKFERLGEWSFLFMFTLAACMGSILNYSIFVCTTVNSALTTAVVGALKNVATTYIGMLVFEDYAFSWVNFFGINISIAGSLYYTYITIFKGATGFGSG